MTKPPPPAVHASSDELVPSQWLDRMSPSFVTDVPERRLLLAVLVDAIRCLQSGSQRDRSSVAAWIRGENGAARLLFQSVCDGLNLEADPLGRRLLRSAGGGKPISRNRVHHNGMMRIATPEARKPHASAQPPSCDGVTIASSA
jgi:hypothetical protein